MTTHTTVPLGPTAWLVEPRGVRPGDYAVAVRRHAAARVVDVVPAAATVLVTLRDPRSSDAFGRWLATLDAPVRERENTDVVEIPVSYDGEDLEQVAVAVGRGVDEVVARHAGADYTCAFCGFAPGFTYLEGLDPVLHLARRPTPRTRVPAGSVAIAVGYTAVYPSASPGGWHLLGRTELALWDVEHEPPALLTPGTSVRFVPIGQ